MSATTKRYVADLAERVTFTAATSASGVGIAHALGLPVEYAVPIAAGLTVVKGLAAKLVGTSSSAALLPAGTDQAVVQADAHDQAVFVLGSLVDLIRHVVEPPSAPLEPAVASPDVADTPQDVEDTPAPAEPAAEPTAAPVDDYAPTYSPGGLT